MKSASLVVRVTINGKRKNLSPEQAKQIGVSGTFYMRTWEGGKEKWKAIGTDPSQARMAVVRKEREFDGGGRITGSKTLREAIDVFLAEGSVQQDVKTVNTWRNELARFEKITPKIYLKDIDRSDVFAYWNSYKAEGAAPRTIYNRVQSLTTFLKNQGVTGLLKHNELPKFHRETRGLLQETNPSELDTYFSHCNPEERLAYLFFLFTGCREREAVFACWQDQVADAVPSHDVVRSEVPISTSGLLVTRPESGRPRIAQIVRATERSCSRNHTCAGSVVSRGCQAMKYGKDLISRGASTMCPPAIAAVICANLRAQ